MPSNPFRVAAIQQLARRHPDEVERLEAAARDSASRLPDRFGRNILVGNRIITKDGELGRVVRLDPSRGRAVVRLDSEKVRVLSAARVELRRGRPRLDSFTVAAAHRN